MGTTLWYVGVQAIDRNKRELRVWIWRSYPGLDLPCTYSFFVMLLFDMFNDTGHGSVGRSDYEYAGLLPSVHDDIPDDLEREYTGTKDPRKYVEYVEMIRWSGISRHEEEDDEEDEHEVRHKLQAEYLVRVTDNKYLSPRADPTFIGRFYFDTASYDGGKDGTDIPLGLHQTDEIYPVKSFLFEREETLVFRDYVERYSGSIDKLLTEALPIVLRDEPTEFTQELFPHLAKDQQRQFLSILAYANRQDSIFHSLVGKNYVLYRIFSFLSLHDERQKTELREVYLGLYCNKRYPGGYLDFKLLHESSMKHFALQRLLSQMFELCEEREYHILHEIDDVQTKRTEMTSYVETLKQIGAAIGHLDLYVYPNMLCGQSTWWSMKERIEAAATNDKVSNAELVEKIIHDATFQVEIGRSHGSLIVYTTLNGVRVDYSNLSITRISSKGKELSSVPSFSVTKPELGKTYVKFDEDVVDEERNLLLIVKASPVNGTQESSDLIRF